MRGRRGSRQRYAGRPMEVFCEGKAQLKFEPVPARTSGWTKAGRATTPQRTGIIPGNAMRFLACSDHRLRFVGLILAENILKRMLQLAAPIGLLEDRPLLVGILRGARALQMRKPRREHDLEAGRPPAAQAPPHRSRST